MNVLISWVLAAIIVIAGISVVLLATKPTLDSALASVDLSQAEQTMQRLDAAIANVAREGVGSSRLVQVPNLRGSWTVSNGSLIEFRMATSPLAAGIRRIRDGLEYISGFDANCSAGTYDTNAAWILENSYLRVYIQKVDGNVDTSKNILAIESKATDTRIIPTDSSIQIDGDKTTSSGTGFSTMQTGPTMPKCQVHFFVNSTSVSYDIFYTLYSAADFIAVEVKNIQ